MCKQPLIVHYHAKTKQKFLVFCWLPWEVFSWLSSDFDVCQCKTKGWFSDRTARERKKAFPNFTIENQLFILYTIFTGFFFRLMNGCSQKKEQSVIEPDWKASLKSQNKRYGESFWLDTQIPMWHCVCECVERWVKRFGVFHPIVCYLYSFCRSL